MIPNAFVNHPKEPTEEDLAAALGGAKVLWDRLLAELRQECDLTGEEWNSYSKKSGWALRLKRLKRNVVYLSPCQGTFRVGLVLGDRAVEAARHCGLPAPVLRVIDEAKRYAEGTGVQLEVKNERDIASVKKLTAIKLAN